MRYYANNHDVLSVYKLEWDTVETISSMLGVQACTIDLSTTVPEFNWDGISVNLNDYLLFDGEGIYMGSVSAKELKNKYSAIEG